MTRVFKPESFAEQTAFVAQHCNGCSRQLGCTILADARPLDTSDDDYPAALVLDDLGRPSCTSFGAIVATPEPAVDEALPPVTARSLPPAPAADVPAPSGVAPSRRASGAKRTGAPIVFTGALRGVTITTRTARDGSSETTTLRLQLAGGAR